MAQAANESLAQIVAAALEQFSAAFGGHDSFYIDLLIIAVELILVLLAYLLINGLFGLALKRISKLTLARRFSSTAIVVSRLTGSFLLVLFGLVFFSVIAVNGYQLYLGQDLTRFTLDWLERIPSGFWSELLINTGKIFLLVIIARFLVRRIASKLTKWQAKAISYRKLSLNDISVKRFFYRIGQAQQIVIWTLVLYATFSWLPFPTGFASATWIALKVYLLITFGLLFVNAITVLVDSLDDLSKQYAESNNLLAFYQRLSPLMPLLRRSLEYIVYVAIATLILTQVDFITGLAEYGPGIIQGIGLIFVARVAVEVVNLLIDKNYLHEHMPDEQRQRNLTIFPIVKSVMASIVYFTALVLILQGIGFDPIPLLAGAGILGMVIGFGAQPLINDIVSGFFVIFEGSYRVGDVIQCGDAIGKVESISMRTTRLRSPDGQQYLLRNGSMGDIVNFSRDYTNAVVHVGVSADSNLAHVYETLEEVGRQIDAESDDVLAPTEIHGIDDFSGPELVIRTVTRVKPGCHNEVSGQLREMIVKEFERENIVIPFEARKNSLKIQT